MSYLARVPLRWVDLDAQGHVNNAVIADYLKEARVDWLRAGPHGHLLGTSTMVVNNQVEYLAPVDLRTEEVEVELQVGRVDAVRFQLGYVVRQAGQDVARARSMLCLFDYEAQVPRRLSADERAWFAGQSVPLQPLSSLGRSQVGTAAHHSEFTVRWSDLDPYGHVNNVRLFDFYAEARVSMREPGSEVLWLVARQDVDYLGQISHGTKPYPVRSAIALAGRTSLTLVAEVADPDTGAALGRARTVVVAADPGGAPMPMPEWMRAAAERWPAEGR